MTEDKDSVEKLRDDALRCALSTPLKPHGKDEREPGKPSPRRASMEDAKSRSDTE